MNFHKVDVFQISRAAVLLNGVLNTESGRIIYIVHISPVKAPISFNTFRFKLIAQASSCQDIVFLFHEPREITAIRMVSISSQESQVTIIVNRKYILLILRRTIILQSITLSDSGLSCFTTFKFIPSIISNTVSVFILAYPYDTTLTPIFTKRITNNIKVCFTLTVILYTVVKAQNKITAPCAKRSDPTGSTTIIQCILYRHSCIFGSLVLREINELPRSRRELKAMIGYPITLCGRCSEIGTFLGSTLHFNRSLSCFTTVDSLHFYFINLAFSRRRKLEMNGSFALYTPVHAPFVHRIIAD